MWFQDDASNEMTMSEEEAAKVNEMLDDAARSAVDRLDLRGGFYTDPTVTSASWHHMSDADIDGNDHFSCLSIELPSVKLFFNLVSRLCNGS